VWWLGSLIAVAAGGLGFLAWSFRPLPGGQDTAGPPPVRPTLVAASSSAALVQLPGSKAGPPWSIVAFSRDGRRLWTSTNLAERAGILCVDACRSAVGSGSEEVVLRPEVADPPLLTVSFTGEHLGQPTPRMRVLAAGPETDQIVASASRLGTPLSIDAVHGTGRTHLGEDATGDGVAYLEGDQGALFVHPSTTTSAVVLLKHGPAGWRTSGPSVSVPSTDGACFGVAGAQPVAVTLGAQATWVRAGKATPLPDPGSAMGCVVSRDGVVLAGSDGRSTDLQMLGLDGRIRWRTTVSGQGDVSADAQSGKVAATDYMHGTITFIGGSGRVVGRVPGAGAKVVGREVVVVDESGQPTWLPLP
jgi:hypothetical protein